MGHYSVEKQQSGQREFVKYLPLFAIGIVVGVLDLLLKGILPFNCSSGELLINDVIKVIFIGYLGVKIAYKFNLPVWWTKPSKDSFYSYFELVSLGLLIILLNTLTTGGSGVYIRQLESWSWFRSVTPHTAILISARAALTEEVFFRLFFIPLLAIMTSVFTTNKNIYIGFAVIISAIVFGLMHPGFLLALICGLVLGYLYSKYGIAPVLVIHFIANAIPFVYLSIT